MDISNLKVFESFLLESLETENDSRRFKMSSNDTHNVIHSIIFANLYEEFALTIIKKYFTITKSPETKQIVLSKNKIPLQAIAKISFLSDDFVSNSNSLKNVFALYARNKHKGNFIQEIIS